MSEWQPTGTEPKDGTHFLAFCPDDEPRISVVCWWADDENQFITYVDELLQNVAPEGPNPTHWMHLPEPPA